MKIHVGLQLLLSLLVSQITVADSSHTPIDNDMGNQLATELEISASEITTHKKFTSNHSRKTFNSLPIKNVILVGTKKQKQRLKRWLNDISVIPKGYITLQAIEKTGHTLTIKHSDAARLSSGRTIAPMTQKITNGTGDDITIIFDADMDDIGTHRVFGVANELIEFNAQQNLYHELAHAMHLMQGTWRYFASEKQAIEEENEFRVDWAKMNGEKPRLRYHTNGVLITTIGSGGIGYKMIKHK